MAQGDPRVERQALLEVQWSAHKEEVLSDLERAHSCLRDCVARVDIMWLRHRPSRPACRTSTVRQRLADCREPIQFANSDLSGISIFEEAQYRGVRAAERVHAWLGFRKLDYAAA